MFVSIRLITEVAGVKHYYYHNYCCVLICSGGFMGDGESHHFVQAALDVDELRLQTIDPQGPVKQQYACPSGT